MTKDSQALQILVIQIETATKKIVFVFFGRLIFQFIEIF